MGIKRCFPQLRAVADPTSSSDMVLFQGSISAVKRDVQSLNKGRVCTSLGDAVASGSQQTAIELRDGSIKQWSELQVSERREPLKGCCEGRQEPEIERRLGIHQ
jgi:hypothetical protein